MAFMAVESKGAPFSVHQEEETLDLMETGECWADWKSVVLEEEVMSLWFGCESARYEEESNLRKKEEKKEKAIRREH